MLLVVPSPPPDPAAPLSGLTLVVRLGLAAVLIFIAALVLEALVYRLRRRGEGEL